MIPENTAGNERRQMHCTSQEQSPSLAAKRPPSPPVHTQLLPSLGMGDHQTASYPAWQSTGLVGSDPPDACKPSACRSPLAGEPQFELSPWTKYTPLKVSTPVPGSLPSVSAIFSSLPILKGNISANSRPKFYSQVTNPPASNSTYDRFGPFSPAISGIPAPLPVPKLPLPLFGTIDPIRMPPGIPGGEILRGETLSIGAAVQPESTPLPGMIPCYLDQKSGSSSQAKKRKANSDAAARFRTRKKNEMEKEQRIRAQEDTIRKQSDTLDRRAQEIEELLREREFYRAERDFYRDSLARLVPASRLQTRPTSPRSSNKPFWLPLENMAKPAGELAPEKLYRPAGILAGPAIPSSQPPGPWSSVPPEYTRQPSAVPYCQNNGSTWRLS